MTDDDDLFEYFEEYDYDDDGDDQVEEKKPAEKEPVAKQSEKKDKKSNAKADAEDTKDAKPAEEVKAAEPEPEPEPVAEPEPDPDPDSPEAIEALRKHNVRIDLNDKGMAWRVFLYEKCGDPALALLGGLPSLKEVWVIGSKCTKKGIAEYKEHAPKVKVY